MHDIAPLVRNADGTWSAQRADVIKPLPTLSTSLGDILAQAFAQAAA